MSDQDLYKSKVDSYHGFQVILKAALIVIFGTLALMAIFLT